MDNSDLVVPVTLFCLYASVGLYVSAQIAILLWQRHRPFHYKAVFNWCTSMDATAVRLLGFDRWQRAVEQLPPKLCLLASRLPEFPDLCDSCIVPCQGHHVG